MPYFQGAYSGLWWYPYKLDSAGCAACDTMLDILTGGNGQNSVVSITCFPTEYFTLSPSFFDGDYQTFKVDNENPVEYPDTFVLTNNFIDPQRITQYKPKNNKLYTYPYMQIEVDCLSSSKTFSPERFVLDPNYKDSAHLGGARFTSYGCLSPDPEITVIPKYYDGEAIAVEQAQIVSGFPQFAYVVDSYRAWQALHSTAMQVASAGQVIGGIVGSAAGGNIGGTISSSLSGVSMGEAWRIEREKGDTIRGAQGSNALIGTRLKGVYFRQKGLLPEYAEIIDNFFTRYGYSCGKVKVPYRNVRPHYTFTKTQNCAVTGNVPASSLEKIRAIYNAGITFWRNASEVGDYTVNNAPA